MCICVEIETFPPLTYHRKPLSTHSHSLPLIKLLWPNWCQPVTKQIAYQPQSICHSLPNNFKMRQTILVCGGVLEETVQGPL